MRYAAVNINFDRKDKMPKLGWQEVLASPKKLFEIAEECGIEEQIKPVPIAIYSMDFDERLLVISEKHPWFNIGVLDHNLYYVDVDIPSQAKKKKRILSLLEKGFVKMYNQIS